MESLKSQEMTRRDPRADVRMVVVTVRTQAASAATVLRYLFAVFLEKCAQMVVMSALPCFKVLPRLYLVNILGGSMIDALA